MSPALVPIVRPVARQAGCGHLQHDGELAVDEEDVDDEEGKQVGDEDDDNKDDVNLHLGGHLHHNGNDLVVDVGDEESEVHLGGHDAPLVLPLVDYPRAGARAQAGKVERAADLRRTIDFHDILADPYTVCGQNDRARLTMIRVVTMMMM